MYNVSHAALHIHCNGNTPSGESATEHSDGSYSVDLWIGRNALSINGSLDDLAAIAKMLTSVPEILEKQRATQNARSLSAP